ncbi:hypothetical protein HBI73_025390 [Parastagonospora nodorum]|nr:hypothetical protein HBH74_224650 [Parastagonospora nodorum]KAH4991095.1 hypothetical protein HBH73_017970 [Parastagonospora nodorum]KAH5095495.1 hypothetical protein HBH72_148680 [Parastagonospora nodorum]KAH5166479.1 hypothetical protein HBI73_025390 [Parastagonospora nodorum]KAH5310281.1 hypothetical protein HBI50_164500 [Parastagonospora nodorum]
MTPLQTGHLEPYDLVTFTNGLEFILRRDWFTRLWIAQELTLAVQDPIVNVGYETVSWSRLASVTQILRARLCDEEELEYDMNTARLDGFQKDTVDDLGDDVYPAALIACADMVKELADLRNGGTSASFSQQFLRTKYLCATDIRDRVFGILGISSFQKEAITPDYTNSVVRVFAEAAATIIQEDLGSYVEFQLWQYSKAKTDASTTWANWVPDFSSLWPSRAESSIVIPRRESVEQALSHTLGLGPVANFSKNFRFFSTVGRLLGRFVTINGGVIAVPGSKPRSTRYNTYSRIMEHHALAATTFLTDTGYIGNASSPIRRDGEHLLVGLFGINIPFILAPAKDGYFLECVAYVAGHEALDEPWLPFGTWID